MMEDYIDARKSSGTAPVRKFSKKKALPDNPEMLDSISSNSVHVIEGEETKAARLARWLKSILAGSVALSGRARNGQAEEPKGIHETVDSEEFDYEEKEMIVEASPGLLERLRGFFSFSGKPVQEKLVADDDSAGSSTGPSPGSPSEAQPETDASYEGRYNSNSVEPDSFLRRMLNRLGLGVSKAGPDDEMDDELVYDDGSADDMKEIAKIATDVIKKLPPHEFRKFKDSEDFVRFKEILERRKLIRK